MVNSDILHNDGYKPRRLRLFNSLLIHVLHINRLGLSHSSTFTKLIKGIKSTNSHPSNLMQPPSQISSSSANSQTLPTTVAETSIPTPSSTSSAVNGKRRVCSF